MAKHIIFKLNSEKEKYALECRGNESLYFCSEEYAERASLQE